MLQKQTVNSTLFRILEGLMLIPGLSSLRLVGGTALALQLGHRESVDIDLFGEFNCELEELYDQLKELGSLEIQKKSNYINIVTIDGVKVDIVKYRYPWIDDLIQVENIKMASPVDISAMKLNAITGRGSKKDFVDLHYLLKKYSFQDLFNFYNKKYDDGNTFLVKKSLTYFVDADREPMPRMHQKIEWDEIKQSLIQKTNEFINNNP